MTPALPIDVARPERALRARLSNRCAARDWFAQTDRLAHRSL